MGHLDIMYNYSCKIFFVITFIEILRNAIFIYPYFLT